MTEYDFSPEGYDRYMRTQQRIAQWVDTTEAYRPQFSPDAHHLWDPSLLAHAHAMRPPPGHRPTRSMHEVPHYHPRRANSPSSSASDSEEWPVPQTQQHGLHPMYASQQPLMPTSRGRTSASTRKERKHKHRSHSSRPPPTIQTYLVSPPPNTPAPQYPYSYNVTRGNVVSPGPYGYTSKGSNPYYSSPATTPYSNPNTYYTSTQAQSNTYPFPLPTQQPYSNPNSAPPALATGGASFSIYAPRPQQPSQQQQPPTYPYAPYIAGAHPPTVYPLTAPPQSGSAQQQQQPPPVFPSLPQQATSNPKPLFYQRIFKTKSKGSSRKST